MWYANRQLRRAFKVVRKIKRRNVVKLRTAHGCEFEETPDRLEANGYRLLKTKPSYADESI